jgi:membrane-associated phospholipid phosphatase
MKAAWRSFFSEQRNKRLFIVSVVSLSLILFLFLHFLTYNEARIGYVFHDPVLKLWTAKDISLLTFILTYGLAVTGLIIALFDPPVLVLLLAAYALLTLIRICCLYLLPLEPPEGIIPLQDIFLRFSFYSGRENLKDLFFSGHTATIFLFAFSFKSRMLKVVFTAGGLLIGFLLMLQHVHYSIDVIVAPVIAWLSVFIVKSWMKKHY